MLALCGISCEYCLRVCQLSFVYGMFYNGIFKKGIKLILFFFPLIYLSLAALGLRCCMWAFSSCGEQGLLFVAGHGLLIAAASLGCGARALGTRAQQLWLTGLVAPRHVGSFLTRARTHVPCIGRRILNHCATREVPHPFLFLLSLGSKS